MLRRLAGCTCTIKERADNFEIACSINQSSQIENMGEKVMVEQRPEQTLSYEILAKNYGHDITT